VALNELSKAALVTQTASATAASTDQSASCVPAGGCEVDDTRSELQVV
jgi:hypothetical protein